MRWSGFAFLGFAFLCIALLPLPAAALTLTSPDLKDGARIAPEQIYTRCGGSNVSPALAWSGAPAGTKSLAFTVIDSDAGPNYWSHWIVVGIPPGTKGFPKGMKTLPPGAAALMSDFGAAAYDGPCPPAGSGIHHYHFTVWALPAAKPALSAAHNAIELQNILAKSALASATITGTFER